ncbi:MAG: hypothetical protein WDN75_01000 [Bacteroidota bacterium]
MHIDAWREVKNVDGFEVRVEGKGGRIVFRVKTRNTLLHKPGRLSTRHFFRTALHHAHRKRR